MIHASLYLGSGLTFTSFAPYTLAPRPVNFMLHTRFTRRGLYLQFKLKIPLKNTPLPLVFVYYFAFIPLYRHFHKFICNFQCLYLLLSSEQNLQMNLKSVILNFKYIILILVMSLTFQIQYGGTKWRSSYYFTNRLPSPEIAVLYLSNSLM